MDGNRRGFTLIECIIALALFAMASVMIAQTCFNCINAIDLMKKDPNADALRDFVRMKVMEVSELDSLKSGISFENFDNSRIDVSGEISQTAIPDLFLFDYKAKGANFEFSEQLLLLRRNWYENISDRSDLVTERTKELERSRNSFLNRQQ